MDTFERVGISVAVAIVLFFGWAIYYESQQPTFSLKKDEWKCTAEHTQLRGQLVGKVTTMVPHQVCDKWERI